MSRMREKREGRVKLRTVLDTPGGAVCVGEEGFERARIERMVPRPERIDDGTLPSRTGAWSAQRCRAQSAPASGQKSQDLGSIFLAGEAPGVVDISSWIFQLPRRVLGPCASGGTRRRSICRHGDRVPTECTDRRKGADERVGAATVARDREREGPGAGGSVRSLPRSDRSVALGSGRKVRPCGPRAARGHPARSGVRARRPSRHRCSFRAGRRAVGSETGEDAPDARGSSPWARRHSAPRPRPEAFCREWTSPSPVRGLSSGCRLSRAPGSGRRGATRPELAARNTDRRLADGSMPSMHAHRDRYRSRQR